MKPRHIQVLEAIFVHQLSSDTKQWISLTKIANYIQKDRLNTMYCAHDLAGLGLISCRGKRYDYKTYKVKMRKNGYDVIKAIREYFG